MIQEVKGVAPKSVNTCAGIVLERDQERCGGMDENRPYYTKIISKIKMLGYWRRGELNGSCKLLIPQNILSSNRGFHYGSLQFVAVTIVELRLPTNPRHARLNSLA
jgi:hypothetical protein